MGRYNTKHGQDSGFRVHVLVTIGGYWYQRDMIYIRNFSVFLPTSKAYGLPSPFAEFRRPKQAILSFITTERQESNRASGI